MIKMIVDADLHLSGSALSAMQSLRSLSSLHISVLSLNVLSSKKKIGEKNEHGPDEEVHIKFQALHTRHETLPTDSSLSTETL